MATPPTPDTNFNAQLDEDKLPEWARDPSKLPIAFKPIFDQVVLFPDPQKKKSSSGVLFAETTRGAIECVGTVLAVGPGRISEYCAQRIPMEIEVGKRYMFQKHAGDDYTLDEKGNLRPWTGRVPSGQVLVKILRQTAMLPEVTSSLS